MTIIDRNFTGALSHDIGDYPEGVVLVIDKPWRWTSADVIRKVKWAACRHFGKKNLKVGHAGTLDPLASGVLIVCIGAACKQAQAIQATSKQYLAGVCFGAVTASYDREKPVEPYSGGGSGARVFTSDNCDGKTGPEGAVKLTAADINAVLPSMLGPQEQVAPLFSAKQVDGKRAYELARKLYAQGGSGTLDESAASLLNIGHIEISSMVLEGLTLSDETLNAPLREGDVSAASSRINVAEVPAGLTVASIRIDCSKGTYIRAIARDLGEKLGTGAFLGSLRRTRCGDFHIEDALTVDDLSVYKRQSELI